MTVEYKIDAARIDDLPAISAFQRAAIARVQPRVYPTQVLAAWRRMPTHGLEALIAAGRYFVVRCAAAPVAGAGWSPHDDLADTAVMRAVYVHPDHAGRGLGRDLLVRIEGVIALTGLSRILVPAALNAAGFYEKLGYHGSERSTIKIGPRDFAYLPMWKQAA